MTYQKMSGQVHSEKFIYFGNTARGPRLPKSTDIETTLTHLEGCESLRKPIHESCPNSKYDIEISHGLDISM